ncbi:MAG: hypothetical protein ACP5PX_00200 [Candidatus Hadarchaeum sp.]|uniref:hypothetical protein n=1 Tax=Candidatus Hadarchaeum sp. TaxID=2883567 RepID=UPI003D0CEC63
MACISPDGKPTESGRKILLALAESRTPEEVAKETNLPLFRVRAGLRELVEAGLVREEQGKYLLTDSGRRAADLG